MKLKTPQTEISNWVYLANKKDSARFVLGEQGKNTLAFIGLNPSTAKPNELDNTMKSVKRIANFNGYDGWMMYNIYALRATNPKDLPKRSNKKLHQQNIDAIVDSIETLNIKSICLAYGDLIETRSYLANYLIDISVALKTFELDFLHINILTKKGHPRHPLYQATKSKLQIFSFC